MSSASIAPMSLPRTPGGGRVTQLRVIVSEWTKFRSLRSTRYTLLATVGFTVGLALAAAILVVTQWGTMTPANKATFQPLNVSLVGASIGVMVIGVLGVLMMTSEYLHGTGQLDIRSRPKASAGAVGQGDGVYARRAVCDGAGHVDRVLRDAGDSVRQPHVRLHSDTAALRARCSASALYLTIAGLLGLGLGGIFRSTAAAVTSLTVILFVLPVIDFILPAGLVEHYLAIPTRQCRPGDHEHRSAGAHAGAVGGARCLRRIRIRIAHRRGSAARQARRVGVQELRVS